MTETDPRKTPQQERAQAKVEALLDAAASILADEGWEALSTNAVARAAAASIGSVYQYFPNKEAMVAELIRRDQTRFLTVLETELGKMRGRPWLEGIGALVSVIVDDWLAATKLKAALHYAEQVLPVTQPRGRATIVAVAEWLADYHITEPETTAQDVLALVRGVAASAEGADREMVRIRALRAAWGYINTSGTSIRLALK